MKYKKRTKQEHKYLYSSPMKHITLPKKVNLMKIEKELDN